MSPKPGTITDFNSDNYMHIYASPADDGVKFKEWENKGETDYCIDWCDDAEKFAQQLEEAAKFIRSRLTDSTFNVSID